MPTLFASPSANPPELVVVMPVYNEEASIGRVVDEWCHALNLLKIDYQLFVLNDGSRDGTRDCLDRLESHYPRLVTFDKANSGHGQTCIIGYRHALALGASYILQVDSDGQCDPRYFAHFWDERDAPAVMGVRVRRDDGQLRLLISRFVQLVTWAATGIHTHDANVPYRLIRHDVLELAMRSFPTTINLANVLLAVALEAGLQEQLKIVPIGFRQRFGGKASVKGGKFFKAGVSLYQELRHAQPYLSETISQLRTLLTLAPAKSDRARANTPTVKSTVLEESSSPIKPIHPTFPLSKS